METNKENCVEFLTGENTCVVSFTSPKYCNRIRRLYEKNSTDFGYLHENSDHSVCAKIPLSWLKITPPTKRELSEAEKEILRQRLAESRKH